MDSILTSIKKLLGNEENDTDFDTDIIIHINSALHRLWELGVGPTIPFSISDKSAKWSDFMPAGEIENKQIRTYVYLYVKLVFDPPLNGTVIEAFKAEIQKLEWLMLADAEMLR